MGEARQVYGLIILRLIHKKSNQNSSKITTVLVRFFMNKPLGNFKADWVYSQVFDKKKKKQALGLPRKI